MGFIVGLNRDRDSYQVPLALAERGLLDQFVTDYYEGKGLSIPTLSHRKSTGISPDLVTESHRAFWAQMPYEIMRRVKKSVDFPSHFVEKNLGMTIASVAQKYPNSDLLLYSGSAKWAFERASSGVRKILFQYHPSPEFIAETMKKTDELAGVRAWQQEAEVLNPSMQDLHTQEVALADSAICASTFTKRGLIQQGMRPEQITIAPYGGPEPKEEQLNRTSRRCEFLFAGQGVARKGLHILLEAWKQARLSNSHLTIVASRLDPEIEAYAQGIRDITIKGRLAQDELAEAMKNSDTFVLPSLVEGYGLVLGEALACGARLIASTNTGLVDMDLPESIGTVVEAGKVDCLKIALQKAEQTYDPQRPYRFESFEHAKRLSWQNFRNQIRKGVSV